ncbi:hypothetical protein QCA50_014490 [Cerrena zonata]|uniref:Uncharacterized protein n=1 Tax=Cerrena zonata TaxID=2478898 RepID=A0AAW0FYB0_9APHY
MARDGPGDEIAVVVKFTAKYHVDAHKLFTKHGLVPKLHFFAPLVGAMSMVVMEYIDNQPRFRTSFQAEDSYSDIKEAIELLHSKNLVFGDLRLQIILFQ